MSPTDRLNEFVRIAYGGNKSAFAAALGWKPRGIYKYMSGKRSATGRAFLVDVEEKAGANRKWIETGKGKMFANNNVGRRLEKEYRSQDPDIIEELRMEDLRDSDSIFSSLDLEFASTGAKRDRDESRGWSQALTLAGAASARYDGSAEREIPVVTASSLDSTVVTGTISMTSLAPHFNETLAVAAQRENMLYDDIRMGDIILVDSFIPPQHGHIIMAFLDGEAFVRRLDTAGNHIRLMPAENEFEIIGLKSGMSFEIAGVVTRIIREVRHDTSVTLDSSETDDTPPEDTHQE